MSGIWTRNYTNILTSMFGRSEEAEQVTGLKDYSSSNLSITTLVNEIYKINSHVDYASVTLKKPGVLYTSNNRLSEQRLGLMVGRGTRAVSYEDYSLDAIISSGITLVTAYPPVTNTYNDTTHSYTYKRTFSIQNTSLVNIIITEVGLVVPAYKESGGRASLIYREVLPAEISLEPNDIILITIEQEMPLYNYQPYPV